ncbi:CAP domain-containing protein [Actinoplanes sp. NPDC026619]|uniref:CAP domain-containing protein n=1 Tax=Actinoplanes sp. NPDC026619 TaxID=3155798 RepID=UPI0033F56419
MKRFAVIAALVALPLFASAPAFAAETKHAPAKKVSAMTMAQYEAEVVQLTNAQRTARGCKALRTDDRLTKAARAHSADMVAEHFFDHVGSNGSTFVAREVAAGYPKRGASAENIAWGYRTPQQVVTGWMNSSGHRANILNCGSIAVGVGVAYTAGGAPYWTQDFGRI